MFWLTRFHNLHLLTEWEGQMGKYWLKVHVSWLNIFLFGPTPLSHQAFYHNYDDF